MVQRAVAADENFSYCTSCDSYSCAALIIMTPILL